MTPEKIADVKRIISESNWPKYPRVDRFGLFVGNLPYSYGETDVADLFAEYGVLAVALVRDPEGASKGFAFIEVSAHCKVKVVHDRECLSRSLPPRSRILW